MKNLAIVLFGGLLFSTAAARDINESLDAHPEGRVSVYNLAGDVQIEGWSRNRVEVTGELGDDVDDFVFERDGKTIDIRVEKRGHRSGRVDVSSDLRIRVPRNNAIEVSVVSADIEVTGVHGEQELQAVSGDVVSETFKADVEIEAVSGDVDVRGNGSDTDTDLTSVSGDIVAEGLAGTIEAESVSGDVEVVDGSFDKAQLETVNGDIVYQAVLRKGGKLDVETVNGSVDIEFSGTVSASFDIETFNGRIRNCFGPKAKRVSRFSPGWELSFTEGKGNGRVVIATLNGDLELCKE